MANAPTDDERRSRRSDAVPATARPAESDPRAGAGAWPVRLAPSSLGLWLAVALVGGLLLCEWGLGRLEGDGWIRHARELRIATFHCLAVAYLVAAWLGVHHALQRARGDLDAGDAATLLRQRPGWLPLGAALGLTISLTGPFLADHPTNPWLPLADVFDRRRVDAIGRTALALALWPAGFFVVAALLLIERDHWIHFLILTPLIASNAGLALAPSFLRLRRRIVALKAAERARLCAVLNSIHARLPLATSEHSGHYADLKAALDRVAAVYDWPIDRESGLGVGLLIAMPALSALLSGMKDSIAKWLFG